MSSFLNDRDFQKFRDYIYEKSGINFCTSNRMILESRLKELLRRYGLDSLDEYYTLISTNIEELKILLDAVTTNLTRFFRNAGHFDAFRNYVIPKLVEYKKRTGSREVRVWSAGCSTGEEPYSIAMVLKDLLPKEFRIKVLASDLSLKSLLHAKQGRYEVNKVKDISDEYLGRFLELDGDYYNIKQEIKDLVQFDYHNLTFESYVNDIDVVFCRNVLIYFDEVAQLDTVHKFWSSMKPLSFLFIGHSESLFGLNTPFEFVKTEWTCLYAKNSEQVEL